MLVFHRKQIRILLLVHIRDTDRSHENAVGSKTKEGGQRVWKSKPMGTHRAKECK